MRRIVAFWTGLLVLGAVLVQVSPVAAEPVGGDFTGDSVILVVDVSGSMSGTPLTQAKEALHSTIASLDDSVAVGLRSYAGSCGNGGVRLVDVGLDNRAELDAAVDTLSAGGGTPTPDALRAAVGDLPPQGNRSVVLVSDGASSCGSVCPVASELVASEAVDFTVFTVGFNAPTTAETDLSCVASATGGTYVEATDTVSLIDAINGAVTSSLDLRYVALGDSFSSGEGAGAGYYFQDAKGKDIKCHRAPSAWSFVLAETSPSILDDVQNAACSGAKTQHVQDSWFQGEQPQVDRLGEVNDATTVDLVTITIGGNDIGFGGLVRHCLIGDCARKLGKMDKQLSRVRIKLINTFNMVAEAAPDAEIVVVGYPRLLPVEQPSVDDHCAWLEPSERIGLNTLTTQLNLTVESAAEASSFFNDDRVTFADVTAALDGRELCTPDSAVVEIYGNPKNTEQAHPNQEGQVLYAEAVLSELKALGIVP